MSARRTLNKYGRELQEEFESEMWDACCNCHINPPCNYCMHPGNPDNLEETPEAWDYEENWIGIMNEH